MTAPRWPHVTAHGGAHENSLRDWWIIWHERGDNHARVLRVVPERRAEVAEAQVEELLDLLEAFVHDDECWYDHHGYCQAHFLGERPCENSVARALLARLRPKS